MTALDALGRAHDFDAIVHLGAQAGVRHSLDAPGDYVRSNLAGHANILELARARQCSHFVYASSSSVYGGNVKLPFAVGDAVDHPVSLYAATKRSNELMSDAYAHLFGIPQTGLRFFTVYGPWGRPDMAPWIFTEAVLRGAPIRLHNGGRMKRDFTYIDDIVAGVLAALDRPPQGTRPHKLYNLGNDRAEELTRFVALIEAATGRHARRSRTVPLPPGDVLETHAEIGATRDNLGYDPRTSLEAGLPRFVDVVPRTTPGFRPPKARQFADRLNPLLAQKLRDRVRAIDRAELAPRVVDMEACRRFRHAEDRRDFPVGLALGDEGEGIAFARRQA